MFDADAPDELRERLARLDRIVRLAGADPSKPLAPQDVARVHEVLEATRRAHGGQGLTVSATPTAPRSR